jgi:hypothetical protein
LRETESIVEASVEAGKPYIPALKRPEVKSAGIAAFLSRSVEAKKEIAARAVAEFGRPSWAESRHFISCARIAAVAFAPAAAPEPSTWAMMLVGFLGLGYFGHKARRGNVLQAALRAKHRGASRV